jgi:uncharacterized membrane protein
MTTSTDTEVGRYLARVRAALSDLPTDERDDMLDDLEAHLAEVLDEVSAEDAGGTLESRLGSPEAYAAELRAAAGLAPAGPRWRRPDVRHRLARLQARPGVREAVAFLPELRPGWWVLRGLLAATGLAVLFGGSVALGVVLALLAVPASVWLGRRTVTGPRRLATLAMNAGIALTGLVLLVNAGQRTVVYSTSDSPVYSVQVDAGLAGQQGPVTNIYPYAKDGTPLQDVLLYDQNGTPILLTDEAVGPNGPLIRRYPYTADGQAIQNAYPQDQAEQDTSSYPPVIRRLPAPRVIVPQFATPSAGPDTGRAAGSATPTSPGPQPTSTGAPARPVPGKPTPTRSR